MRPLPQRGFALLITIVLLAFLVLLLVSLSSLTRVETQVSANQQQVTLARQNALLGLNIALGQLQKYAGPDQRVTATADLNSTAAAPVANPHYTGVWNVAAVNASARANIPLSPTVSTDADIATAAGVLGYTNPTVFKPTALPDPTKPDVWLVSGNENPSAPTAVAYNTDTSGSSFVTLVGANTATDTVRVAAVPITSASVPGVSGNVTTGKFAYWIGDEGVKAKFNLADPYTPRPAADASTPAFTPTAIQTYDRQTTAQRHGIEQMDIDGNSTVAGTTPIGSAYNPTANTTAAAQLIRDLGKVLSPPDMLFTTGMPSSAALKNRYFDLTTSSYGLLTDTANGGLKYDLTWDFSQPSNPSNKALKTGAIVQAVTWIPPTSALGLVNGQPPTWWPSTFDKPLISQTLDPQWDVLRDFYQLSPALSPSRFDGNSVMLSSMLPSGAGSVAVLGNGARTNNPIMPVFVQARLYFGAENSSTNNSDGTPGVNGKDYVVFIVANPYDMALSVPYGLSFTFSIGSGGDQDIPMQVRHAGSIYNYVNLLSQFPGPGGSHWFTCPGPLSFAPGEVKAFTLAADAIGGGSSAAQLQEMTASSGDPTTYAVKFPLTKSGSSIVTGWQVNLTPPLGSGGGYCTFSMYSNTGKNYNEGAGSQHLAGLKYIAYALPASGTGSNGEFSNGATTADYDIGGLVFSLRMPAETAYSATSSIRFLADYNTRAMNMGSYQQDGLYLYFSYFNNSHDSFSQNTVPATWGLSSSFQTENDTNAILYHIPRPPPGAPPWEPVIMSIADLQNANITTTAQEPTYAIGNSYASVFCQPDRSVSVPQPCNSFFFSRTNPSWRYDMSYLCNEALWDTYYFSTVPQTSVSASATYNPQTDTLPDSRYVPIAGPGGLPTQAQLTASSTAAASLLRINGAFNVNSTSVEAWKAVFSSLRGIDYSAPDGTSTDTNLSSPFFRSLWQTHGKTDTSTSLCTDAQTGTDMNSWTGFRNLSSAEVDALATQMVAQVRLRGPFRSLGDFVNRRLLTATSDSNGLRLRGTLQAAIDAAGVNSQFNSTGNSTVPGNDVASAFSSPSNTQYSATNPSQQWMTPPNAVGNRATGAPGWLMQADVLQAIGATLADRSDTFTVRSYGEAINPVTGATESKAWCEAVVQRVPDYVDPTNAPTIAPAPASLIPTNPLTATNQTFGRRFKIVSFRWLGPGDI